MESDRRPSATGEGGAPERWLERRVGEEEAGRTVRELLLRSFRLSRRMIRRLFQSHGIRLDGAEPFLSTPVGAGAVLAVRLSSADAGALRPVPMELDIVLEDEDVLVVDKPAGLLVHPTRASHVRTLAHGVLAHYQRQGLTAAPHPVHRLDRDTTGLVLFARHPVAHQRLDRQLRARRVRRSYLAVVDGVLAADAGRVEVPLARHPADPHLRSAAPEGGSDARTAYRVVERFPDATLVEVELETGRTHQIRVHMAHIGHPLIGDAAYGGREHPLCSRQALHAWRLAFVHPITGERVECVAPLPRDMERLIGSLRGGGEAERGGAGTDLARRPGDV